MSSEWMNGYEPGFCELVLAFHSFLCIRQNTRFAYLNFSVIYNSVRCFESEIEWSEVNLVSDMHWLAFAVWIKLYSGFSKVFELVSKARYMLRIKKWFSNSTLYLLIKIASLVNYWSRTECHWIFILCCSSSVHCEYLTAKPPIPFMKGLIHSSLG